MKKIFIITDIVTEDIINECLSESIEENDEKIILLVKNL
jgi:uncharacterized protein with ATP-grasp and redox domains